MPRPWWQDENSTLIAVATATTLSVLISPDADRYLAEHYRAAFNEELAVAAAEPGTAFVLFIGPGLPDIVADRPSGATHVRVNGATHGC